MRELINIINESVGLANRKPGELFVNHVGAELRFQRVDFYPEGGGQFDTPEQLEAAVKQVSKSINTLPMLVNQPNPRHLAFGIAQFIDGRGNLKSFIKYFNNVKANPKENDWNNQTGIPGYRYASKAASKTQSSATPQDILTQTDDLVPSDIVAQVAAKFPNSSLVTVTQHLANGGALPFTFTAPAEMNLSAFQDYFCELLQPIALMSGQYDGEAGKVEAQFLGDETYELCSINFGKSKTEGLSDSIMVSPSGRRVKVSTKGGGGAPASSKNILDAYNELQKTPEGMKQMRKVGDTIDIINTIVQEGQSRAPLVLGIKYKIINENDAYLIATLKGKAPVPLETINKVPNVSKTIIDLGTSRTTRNDQSVDLYHHLIAAVAHKVAAYVNEHTSFTKDASLILNHSALVQVYTTVTAKGDQWTLNKFNSKWPGSAVSEVVLDATKNYMSTQIKGNFTFIVDPVKKGKQTATATSAKVSKQQVTDKIADIAAGKSTTDLRPTGARARRDQPVAESIRAKR